MDFNNDLFITIPRDKLDIKKFTYIILKKLSLGQLVKNINLGNYYIDFTFVAKDSEYKYDYLSPNRKNIIDLINIKFFDNNPESVETIQFKLCKLGIELIQLDFKFTNVSKLLEENIDKYKNYLFDNENFNLSYNLTKRFHVNVPNQNRDIFILDDSYFDQKIGQLMNSFVFYTEQQNDFISFIHNLDSNVRYITKLKKNNDISLSMCNKFRSKISFFDKEINLPLQKNIITVINFLKEITYVMKMNDLKDFKLQGSFFNITVYNSFQVYLNGFLMFKEKNLDKFKYLFHPGFYFFVKYLEDTNNIDTVNLNIQKALFKNV
jgi:hypothetical protein